MMERGEIIRGDVLTSTQMIKLEKIIIDKLKKLDQFYKDENFATSQEFQEIMNHFKVMLPTNNKLDVHYCTNIMFSLKRHVKDGYEAELKKLLLQEKEIAQIDFVNGYINMKMNPCFFADIIQDIQDGDIFPNVGHGEKINVEYCSINPTGFLHIGHARNAIIGDTIARILSKINFDVTKEYYVNDAGNQINLLAESIYARFCEARGIEKALPEGGYKGPEIKAIAEMMIDALEGIDCTNEHDVLEKTGTFAINYFLEQIKEDLSALNIHHDVWTHEKDIIKSGYIEKAVELLNAKGYIYEGTRSEKKAEKGLIENKPLKLLKTSIFGDDEDRPITKGDGSWTYLAPDIGYHLNKIERGFNYLICVLGADHDSYARRIKIAVKLLKEDIKHVTPICQMVSFEEDGQNVKFSKRMGNSLRTREFIEKIEPDVLRFTMISKIPGTPFVFDYENASALSMKNPVFYIQYAYARSCSVLRNTEQRPLLHKNSYTFQIKEIQELVIQLGEFKTIFKESALTPHVLCNYAYKLAECLHKLWQVGRANSEKRFILEGNSIETETRLAILVAYKKILGECLDTIGVKTPESMQ